MSNQDLLHNATHVSDIEGKFTVGTSDPLDEGVAGVATGEVYYDTNRNSLKIKSATKWYGAVFTTTSTSSSTTTSTSTTTSA